MNLRNLAANTIESEEPVLDNKALELKLLQFCADLRRRGCGYIPLIEAVKTGDYQLVKYILDKNKNNKYYIHQKKETRFGNETAIVSAVLVNRIDIVELLVERGANIEDTYTTTNWEILNTFALAKERKHRAIAEFLEHKLGIDKVIQHRLEQFDKKKSRMVMTDILKTFIQITIKYQIPRDIQVKIISDMLEVSHMEQWWQGSVKFIYDSFQNSKRAAHIQVNSELCESLDVTECIGWATQQLLLQNNKEFTTDNCPMPFVKMDAPWYCGSLHLYVKDQSHASCLIAYLKWVGIPSQQDTVYMGDDNFDFFTVIVTIKKFEHIKQYIENICHFDSDKTLGIHMRNGCGYRYFEDSGLFKKVFDSLSHYIGQHEHDKNYHDQIKLAEDLKLEREILKYAGDNGSASMRFAGKDYRHRTPFTTKEIKLLKEMAIALKLDQDQMKCFEFLMNKGIPANDIINRVRQAVEAANFWKDKTENEGITYIHKALQNNDAHKALSNIKKLFKPETSWTTSLFVSPNKIIVEKTQDSVTKKFYEAVQIAVEKHQCGNLDAFLNNHIHPLLQAKHNTIAQQKM